MMNDIFRTWDLENYKPLHEWYDFNTLSTSKKKEEQKDGIYENNLLAQHVLPKSHGK